MIRRAPNMHWFKTTKEVQKTEDEIGEEAKKAIFGAFFLNRIKVVPAAGLSDGRIFWSSVTIEEYNSIVSASEQDPVSEWSLSDKSRRYWLYQGEFYWEDEGFTADQVRALILQRKKTIQKKIKRAEALMELDGSDDANERTSIPDETKLKVWQRDEGRCVKCGSTRNLEFDHIIPLSMGGSSTVRNLQLLCSDCNQSKGPNLA